MSEGNTGGASIQRWAAVAMTLMLVAAVAVPQLLVRSADSATTQPTLGPPQKPSTAGEYRGFTLQLHSSDESIPYDKYIDEVAQTGANTICLSFAGLQENCASSSIFVDQRKVPGQERIKKLVKHARAKGLRVVMMPIVLLENPGTGEWRGKIDPKDAGAWWEDYDNFIVMYARLAEESGVEVFMVGSELVSMEDQTDHWKQLIEKVRGVFKGKVSYSANWDHYENIQYWQELDLVGMTSYYDLVGDKKPTLQVLLDTWKPIKKSVLAWQQKVNRPLLFTEAGWPNQEGCAKEPWNYYGSTKADTQTQALCFKSFFETWKNEPAVGGILIWEWRNYPGQKVDEGATDYCPMGKPAMQVIKDYFASPGALPPASGPTSGPGSRPAGTSAPTTMPAVAPPVAAPTAPPAAPPTLIVD